MMSDQSEEPSSVRQFFSLILMTIGLLMCCLSGACSLYFLVPGIAHGNFFILPYVLVIGGIPFGLGLTMFFAGRGANRP